ncbi:MAG: hypothetical protein JETT_2194 [Candidatus Jettenia ecosi]|uniref:Uncharacterized protein n=1 Tax=Candidatus Jettenia ecosi TaxID=2494326 RepID=A0A533QFW7_9BACT|nr:MAG: hypothetical protein JETT_2194 [Candidatus Jettenia ecosi]
MRMGVNLVFALIVGKHTGLEFTQRVGKHKVRPYYDPTVF